MGTSLLGAAALGLAACSGPSEGGGRQDGPVPAPVTTPETRTVTVWDEYIGRFEAVERVEIRPRVSGYLQEIHFADGAPVAAGDLLFTIDKREFQAALDGANARLESAKAQAEFAQLELTRAENLLSGPAGNRETYDRRTQELRSARADVAGAEAAVREAALNLEFTEVRAPIAGLVSSDRVNKGNLVTAGSTLLTTVVSTDPIHFVFTGSERDYLRYLRLDAEGDRQSSRYAPNPVRIRLEDQEEYAIEGSMNFVDNEINPNTGTIRGRAIVENDDGFLTPGLFGRMRLYGRAPFEALLVPDIAIQFDQSRRFVWVVNEENAATMRPVVIGRLLDDGMRIIEEGLTADDRVVVGSLLAMRPGAPVQPIDQGGAQTGQDGSNGQGS
ncbi:MAG: efflux RND transporter periplasmic adaptor subunit [Pseudomonadota bacterium]